MKSLSLALLAVCSLFAAVVMAADPPAKDAKVLRHIVMYKFKPEMSAAQIQEVVDTFAALPKKIDEIVDFEMGTNVSPEGKSEGFTHCFVVSFRDEAGRDEYLKHPAHLAYVQVVKDRREKVIVFDYWAKP
ncbi:Dabb family protein [Anatilimnocola sp. NA78]|uniref:Dabb family protein n=1 Tax=Anatilimnocola sp. NA78 TaxID=3415683 RepID=UPI003CE544BF